MKTKRWISVLMILVVLISGIGIGFLSLRPPKAPSEESSNYSAYTNMLTNIETMTKKPHPAGSQELAEVRTYLLSQIEAMGLQYEVLSTVVSLDEIAANNMEHQKKGKEKKGQVKKGTGPNRVITPSGKIITEEEMMRENIKDKAVFDENGNLTLYNILVKLDSPSTESGVLFMAHYDSEFGVPGASDDMTSVCALLEAMRRQSKNPNLQNDLYFLFTDGEELSGMGAKVFVRENSQLADKIDLVVNMDARGTSGGLLMFESNMFDYDQVKHFKKATRTPISYSWMSMIYRQMSNGTDLTSFLKTGYNALNFAVAESMENYSSETDDIHHLDRNTAYHYLINAFELSDYAAENSLKDNGKHQNGVYFTLLPGLLVLMNDLFAQTLAAIAVFIAIVWLIWQLRCGKFSILKVLVVSGAQLLIITSSALLSLGAVKLIGMFGRLKRLDNEMLFSIPAFVGIAVVCSVVFYVVFTILIRKRTFSEVIAGILPLLMLSTAVTAIFFNAASYLMSLPLLGLMIAAFVEKNVIVKTITAIFIGTGIILLYFPLCWLLFITLGLSILPLIMAFAAIPITLVAVLLKP